MAQFYTNASSAVVNAIIDHGFCTWEDVGEFIRFENLIAPDGRLPINAAGGDLADGFIHGAGNNAEGSVRSGAPRPTRSRARSSPSWCAGRTTSWSARPCWAPRRHSKVKHARQCSAPAADSQR